MVRQAAEETRQSGGSHLVQIDEHLQLPLDGAAYFFTVVRPGSEHAGIDQHLDDIDDVELHGHHDATIADPISVSLHSGCGCHLL
jgi:hypothetical protein